MVAMPLIVALICFKSINCCAISSRSCSSGSINGNSSNSSKVIAGTLTVLVVTAVLSNKASNPSSSGITLNSVNC